MRSVTIIILNALVVPRLAKELQVNPTEKLDDVSDKLTDKLMDKLLGAASLHGVNLDDTTFAKTHPDKGLGLPLSRAQTRSLSPHARSQILASLPGPSAMKNLAINAIEANSGRCWARGVSVKAAESLPAAEEPMGKDKIQDMAGITAPLGFFDPLGISANVPEGRLLFYREAELKHGRVCMLAVLGLLVGERHDFIPLLGADIPANTPAYLLGTPYVQQTTLAQFWPVALGAVFAEEFRHARQIQQDVQNMKQDTNLAPGDYGWDPLGLKPKDAKAFKELQNKELNNGRLAMFAAAGIIAAEQATGKNLIFHS